MLTHDHDLVALLELLCCVPCASAEVAPYFSDPLGWIVGQLPPSDRDRWRSSFHPLVDSQASPPRPKWQRLPRRSGAERDTIARASSGIGVLTRCPLGPLFGGPSLPRAEAGPVCGYLSTGDAAHTTLLYAGTRDTERRAVLFMRLPAGRTDVVIGVTHLATLLGERERDAAATRAAAARIRRHQGREIAQALEHVRTRSEPPARRFHTVVLGDFNCEPDSPSLLPLRRHGLWNVFDPAGRPYPPTKQPCRGCFDHAWVSEGVVVERLALHTVGRSDHRAVSLTLALP